MGSLTFSQQRRSLLSSQARIQVPWVKVTMGDYTFGIFSKAARKQNSDSFYAAYNIQYPNYIQSLTIKKINGQVNQYSLQIKYPITMNDDPNFFEKVFSSVSNSRKIIFTYGDATQPTYVYKDEEAILTKITQSFNLESSTIQYTLSAVSGAALGTSACNTYINSGYKKPSDEIKRLFKNKATGLQSTFTGMTEKDLDKFIDGSDKPVILDSKVNISVLDYITYLVSCMIPSGSVTSNISKDIYILTIHDASTYDRLYTDENLSGPYFKVTRTSYNQQHSDAYEVDVGYNTSTIVTNFSIEQNENYSLLYNFQKKLQPNDYVRRLDADGQWEDVYAPTLTSKNDDYRTRANDVTWWTKITQYPINASLTVQGLLRPAQLMTYLRLNIIFPGGEGADGMRKHIASGLYIVTSQTDTIDFNGYRTQLSVTKIAS